jgi:hypothetical protein
MVTSAYIATELKKYGVSPFFPDGDYFQRFKLRTIHFSDTSMTSLVNAQGQIVHDLQYEIDFVGSNRYYSDLDTTTGFTFVGYGITADEYNYDDYANLDVNGKIVLFIAGEPESEDSTFFEGSKDSPYASSFRKIDTAAKRGAVGAMYVSTWESRFGWESIVSYVNKGSLQIESEPVSSPTGRLPICVINESSLESLFDHGQYSYQELQSYRDQKKSPPVFEFNTSIQINWKFETDETVETRNVIGIVAGSDPLLKNEYVSIGAHIDHEGLGIAGVYNGADDNGSGTVALLEIARAFATRHENKRTVMFTFHTAEEKGLLGSKYMTENLEIMKNMIAHINMDMVGRGSSDSIYSIGSDKISTEYHQLIETVNKSGVNMFLNYDLNDPNDRQRLYYRSDHWSFAKKDIPVVFFFDYEMEDYNRVTDDVEKINFRKLQKISQLSYEIALAAANHEAGFKKNDTAAKQ